MYDVVRQREVARLQHSEDVDRVAFSTDGKTLVGSGSRSVGLWNLAGAEEKLTLSERGHNGGITGLAFSPDGKRLASGGKDLKVKIWEPGSGKIICELKDFEAGVETVAFSSDGRMLATGEWGSGAIRIWDAQTWQELLPALAHGEVGRQILTVAFSPDGRYFAACGLSWGGADGGVMLWDLGAHGTMPQTAVRLSSRNALSLCFSPESRLLAWVESGNPCLVRLCDLRSSSVHALPRAQPRTQKDALAFLDSKELVFTTDQSALPEVWDIATSNKVFAVEGGTFWGSNRLFSDGRIALSSDGAWLAQSDLAPPVWDLKNKKLLLRLPQERAYPLRLTWSPNNEHLAFGLADGELVIWNLRKIKTQLDAIGLGW